MSSLSLSAILTIADKATRPLKGINAESKHLSDSLKNQNKALKSLQKTQDNIESFKHLKGMLNETNQKLTAAKLATKKLAQEHAALPRVTKTMAKELERAQKSVDRLTASKLKQVSQLKHSVVMLNLAGIKTRQLEEGEKNLAQQIDATTSSLKSKEAQLAQVQAKQAAIAQAHADYANASNFEAQLSSVAVQAAISASAGAAGLSVPITAFAEAEDAWTQLQITMMQSNGKVAPEFKQISDLAINMGNQLPGTTAEFQAMMAKLVQQGISFKDILGGVGKASGNLGVLLKMPFEDAAEFAAKMQDATKTEAKDMVGLMDTIQKSFFLGVDPTNMLSGFSKISAGMKTIKAEGLAGANAIAPLLIMADQASMAGEAAGNAYSKIFKAMLDTKTITKSLKGTNMTMNFTNGKGEFGGLDNMFKQLEKLKGLSTEARTPILSSMFGNDSETIQALNLLIDKGQAGYNETLQKMQSQADLQQRVNAQLGTLKNLWDAATGTFTNAMVTLGQSIEPELKSLTKWITDLAARLDVWIKANPKLVKTVMLVSMGIVSLLAVIAVLSLALMTILIPIKLLKFALVFLRVNLISTTVAAWRYSYSMIGMALNTVKSGAILAGSRILAFLTLLKVQLYAGAVAAWTFMAPFLPIIGAVLLLALAAFLIYKNWEPLKAFFIEFWNKLKTTVGTAIREILNWISMMSERTSAVFTSIKNSVVETGEAFINFLLIPIRKIIDSVNILITQLNKIPSVDIPQIPQIPQFGTVTATTSTTVKPTATVPLRAAAAPANVTNHFAAASINISGVSDPTAVSALVDQKLRLHEQTLASQKNRSYSDPA